MNKKVQTKKTQTIKTNEVAPKVKKNELHGVRIGGYVVSIVELVACITSIVVGVALLITGIAIYTNSGSGPDDKMVAQFLTIFGGVFAALSILGTIVSANVIGMMKRNNSKTRFTVFGVLGIISFTALVTGIMSIVCKCTCKEIQ